MHPYWDELVQDVQTLAAYLTVYDEDGIEIFFGDSRDDWKKVKAKDAFQDAGPLLRKRRPNPESGKVIDMKKAIHYQCHQYFEREKLQRLTAKIKTTTILILTDGAWAKDADARNQLEDQLTKTIQSTSRGRPKDDKNPPLTFGFIYWTDSGTVVDYFRKLDEYIESMYNIP